MRYFFWKALAIGSLLLSSSTFGGPSGEEIHAETLASIGAYDDPELTAYLEGLVHEIVSVSEMAGKEFTFTLLDSGNINAFATADNYVYMNRGLLNYISNEAQLVSVLAHEVGHITQKHVNLMPAAAGGARFLSWLVASLSGSQEVYQAGMAYANSLLKEKERNNELKAEEEGTRYNSKLGYDTEEMLKITSRTWKKSARRKGGRRAVPTTAYSPRIRAMTCDCEARSAKPRRTNRRQRATRARRATGK